MGFFTSKPNEHLPMDNDGGLGTVRKFRSKDGRRRITVHRSAVMSDRDWEDSLEVARSNVRDHDRVQREARAAIERQHRNS
ncbi:MAG TPA: hypothetical protein VLT90_13070 [Terriglobales bacterium]|nr:hypothetical protein [Terriglobales bacterium]